MINEKEILIYELNTIPQRVTQDQSVALVIMHVG